MIGRTEVRGEIVMLKKDFEALNEKRRAVGEPEFANPRNLAAGTIRQLDPRLVAARPLSFRAYDILRDDPTDIPTNMSAYETLSALGVSRNKQASTFSDVNGVMHFIDEWNEKRLDLPFNTDGLVVKVNDRAQFANLVSLASSRVQPLRLNMQPNRQQRSSKISLSVLGEQVLRRRWRSLTQ